MSEMPKSRIHYLIAVGLVVTVSLLLALVAQVGLTTAATGSSGASASGTTLQGKVRIEAKGESNRRFTIAGAIRDRGRWVESPNAGFRDRSLIGTKGTIWIKIGFLGGKPRQCQCNWRIYGGTKAYTGLRGRGYEAGMYQGFSLVGYSPTTHLTMYGTVSH
jgi:hypothetical protein